MKKYFNLKLVRSGLHDVPMLSIGTRKNRRILIDTSKVSSPKYWTTIYKKLGWNVKASQIRLSHDLICMIFDIPKNRINKKFARKLHNSWRIGRFSPSNISYNSDKDVLTVRCPDYNPSDRLKNALGLTKEQIWHLLRQIEPLNELALSAK